MAEPGAEPGRQPVQLRRPGRRGRHLPDSADQGPGQVEPGGERRLAGHVDRGRDRGVAALVGDPAGQLGQQGGLADPGLAGQHHHLPAPVRGLPPALGQPRQLRRPAEHRHPAARPPAAVGPGVDGPGRRRGPYAQVLPQPLTEFARPGPPPRPARRPRSNRSTSERWADSSCGRNAANCRDQRTASVTAPSASARSASSISRRARRSASSARARSTQSSARSGSSVSGTRSGDGSSSTSADASTRARVVRVVSSADPASPHAARTVHTAVRRLARARSASASGHSPAATAAREFGPGCRASQAISARARSLLGRAIGTPARSAAIGPQIRKRSISPA